MKVLDVNVLVNAFRPDAAGHAAAFAMIEQARASRERVVILPEVAVGFLRVVTHARVFADPSAPAEALAALDAWTTAPSVGIHEAGAGRWDRFRELVTRYPLSGSGVHDLLLASAALDWGAALVTSDRGFLRFEGLRVDLV